MKRFLVSSVSIILFFFLLLSVFNLGVMAVPDEVGEIIAWYDASSLVETYEYGERIGKWPDISGNDYHLIQEDQDLLPLFYEYDKEDKLGYGKPVVYFDYEEAFNDLDHHLHNGYRVEFEKSYEQPITVFVVWENDTQWTNTIFDGIQENNRYIFVWDVWEGNHRLILSTESGWPGDVYFDDFNPEQGLYVASGIFNGSDSLLRVNGDDMASGDTGTRPFIGFTLGGLYHNHHLNAFHGYLAELIFIEGNLSRTELRRVERYLAEKWYE